MTSLAAEPAPATDADLEERLSRPTLGVIAALERHPGNLIVLGAGGKMGPSLARMARRALDALGRRDRVIAVSRWGDAATADALGAHGVEAVRADLGSAESVRALPDAPNVIFMAGQKFGTTGAPDAIWQANVVVPALCAERYAGSRIVAFSTGNVYPMTRMPRHSDRRELVAGTGIGPREDTPPAPVGEYAWSCLGRERVLEHAARRDGSRIAIVRLNYAVDLRYGVLVDIARRVASGEPVPLAIGWVNVIWQGDANAIALQCLEHAASSPFVVNVTSPETLSVRAIATRLAARLGSAPSFEGAEGSEALLSDASHSTRLLGAPAVSPEMLIDWVADWVARGGRTLDKPTKFERKDGRY